VDGKNSLPILYGISKKGKFAKRWGESAIGPEEVTDVAQMLVNEGAREFSEREAERLTNQALGGLEKVNPKNEAGLALKELAENLLHRKA
jgi:geranylgeranyl pyrophosphate synthase